MMRGNTILLCYVEGILASVGDLQSQEHAAMNECVSSCPP